jgi:hypothetical protein
MNSVIKGRTETAKALRIKPSLRWYSVIKGGLIRIACFGSLLELAHLFRPSKTAGITQGFRTTGSLYGLINEDSLRFKTEPSLPFSTRESQCDHMCYRYMGRHQMIS